MLRRSSSGRGSCCVLASTPSVGAPARLSSSTRTPCPVNAQADRGRLDDAACAARVCSIKHLEIVRETQKKDRAVDNRRSRPLIRRHGGRGCCFWRSLLRDAASSLTSSPTKNRSGCCLGSPMLRATSAGRGHRKGPVHSFELD